MKGFLRLLFLGVIIGLTVKAVDRFGFDVVGTAQGIWERLSLELAQPGEYFKEADLEEVLDSNLAYPEANEVEKLPVLEFDMGAGKGRSNPRFAELDRYAFSVPERYESNMDELLSYLLKPAESELEKTRLIFSWIAANVDYDDYGFNTGNYSDVSAPAVFRNRRAVCQGFADLLRELAERAGLEVALVSGYSKGITYRKGQVFQSTNHAWNSVRIDGEWRLFDVTWAQGHGTVQMGQLVSVKEFDDFWFDTDPNAFVFTHFPEDPHWQCTSIQLSKRNFEDLPHASSDYFSLGFDASKCLLQACRERSFAFPDSYDSDVKISAESLPFQAKLSAHQPISLRLSSEDAESIAVVNNGDWIYLERDEDVFSGIVSPRPGNMSINVRPKEGPGSYHTILSYTVI